MPLDCFSNTKNQDAKSKHDIENETRSQAMCTHILKKSQSHLHNHLKQNIPIGAHTSYPRDHRKNRTIPRIVVRGEYDHPMKILFILSTFQKS
jgi:hypothetical protein